MTTALNADRRCKFCAAQLVRRPNECITDWRERMSCSRSCHVAWKNAKPIWQTFAECTEVQKSGCIEWIGYRDPKGYGRFSTGWGEVLAHRIAFIMHHGSIPDQLHVLHRCDNPPCINPHHLFAGTNQDNMTDKVTKGRSTSLFGEKNPNYRHGRNCKEKAA